MLDRVLNMPQDYLSCFVVVLRGIHRKVDICQTYYSIHSKLRIFPCSEVIHGSTTFKPTKGSQRLKKNEQLLNLMFLFLQFFVPLSQTISAINLSGTCYFLHALNQWHVYWRVHVLSHTSNAGDCLAPFVFDSFIYYKGLDFKKHKVNFLRHFDNPLSKYLIFKRISRIQWLFWVIYQN